MATYFVYGDSRLKRIPRIVRTYVNGGPLSGGVLVSERVLRPLTAAERKAGVRDELAEHVAKYGRISAPRGSGRVRTHDPECDDVAETTASYQEPPESLQLQIWKAMESYYYAIAIMMARDGNIGDADIEQMVYAMHAYVISKIERYDPTHEHDPADENPFDTFCKQQARDFRVEYIRRQSALKRGGGVTMLSLVGGFKGTEEAEDRRGRISEEAIPGSRRWEEDLFWRDLNSFLATVLTVQERVALKDLYDGETQEDTAKKLNLTLATFRRRILGPIQLFVDYLLPADTHKYSMAAYGSRKFILK